MMTELLALLAQIDGWYHHGWGGGWMWVWGSLMMAGWVALVAAAVVAVWLLVRRTPRGDHTSRAREILAERYARGELSADEYRDRLQTLR